MSDDDQDDKEWWRCKVHGAGYENKLVCEENG